MAKNDLQWTMGIDTVSFAKGLQQAQKLTEQSAKQMQKIMLATAGILATAFGVDKFAGMVNGSIAAGKELDSLSRQSGFAAEQIELMRHAFDRSGQTAESTVEILSNFRQNSGLLANNIGQTANVLGGLGIKMEQFKKLSLVDQFKMTAEAVNKIKDPMHRAATSAALFGTAGAKAVANFSAEDMERAAKNFGTSSKAMGDAAPGLARASDSFKRIQEGGKAFFDIVVAKISPVIELVASKLEAILPDLQETAENFSKIMMDAISILTQAFKEGKLGTLLYLSLKVGVLKTIDFILGVAKGVINVIGEMLGQTLSVLLTGDFWFAFSDGFIGAFKYAANTAAEMFMSVFETPLKALQDSFTFIFENAFAKLTGGTARTFEKIQSDDKLSFFGVGKDDFTKNAKEGKDQLALAGKEFQASLEKGGASFDAIIRRFKDGMKEGGIFGSESEAAMKELEALMSGLLGRSTTFKGKAGDKAKGAAGADSFFKAPTVTTKFDEFRRIGGGAGGVTGTAEKSLSALHQIRDLLKEATKTKNKNFTGAKFSDSALTFTGATTT